MSRYAYGSIEDYIWDAVQLVQYEQNARMLEIVQALAKVLADALMEVDVPPSTPPSAVEDKQ